MRLATVVTPSGPRLHVRGRSGYVDAARATGEDRYASLAGVLESGPAAMAALGPLVEEAGTPCPDESLGPAVPDARRILCLGLNYLEHAAEGGHRAPSWPEIFVRGPGSLCAPYGPLVRPALVEQFDYEGELALVVGEGGRYLTAASARRAVAGYTVVNDASCREWQRAASQWTPGKNFDATMPIGPEVVTVDEVDVDDVQLTTRLNGTVMQSARTSQMIVDPWRAVEFLSSFTTLRPGDVIATGTPAGVGFARNPPVWLEPGDAIEVEIAGVGTIRNEVVPERADVAAWPWRPGAGSGAAGAVARRSVTDGG